MVDVEQLRTRLQEAARLAGFTVTWASGRDDNGLPILSREPVNPAGRIYVSTGVHGDEPAGPLGVLEALRKRRWAEDIAWTVVPLVNPTGLAAGTRENDGAIDLNRDYGPEPQTVEVQGHVAWLGEQHWDLALCLHEDSDGRGAYIYELSQPDEPALAHDVLAAMEPHVGIDRSPEIDGMPAKEGVMQPSVEGIRTWERDLPEAVWLWRRHTPICLTLETPSAQPIVSRVQAQVAGLCAAVEVWRNSRAVSA